MSPTHRCRGLASVLLHSFLSSVATAPPPIWTGFLHAASLPAGLQPALHTLFPHVNLTSPLKDWPHSKLLFKGKKYTLRGWKEVVGCVSTSEWTRIPLRARWYRKRPGPARPSPGLADNLTVSWSQSLCASHFLSCPKTAAALNFYPAKIKIQDSSIYIFFFFFFFNSTSLSPFLVACRNTGTLGHKISCLFSIVLCHSTS